MANKKYGPEQSIAKLRRDPRFWRKKTSQAGPP